VGTSGVGGGTIRLEERILPGKVADKPGEAKAESRVEGELSLLLAADLEPGLRLMETPLMYSVGE